MGVVKRLGGVLMMVFFATAPAWAGGKRPQFTFRIHLQADESYRQELCIPLELPDPPVRLLVQKFAVLGEKQILDAKPNGQGGLLLEFKPDGRSALEAATSNNPGKLMVVLMNGRVVYAARIDKVLSSGRLILPVGVTPQDEELLEAYLVAQHKL